ncbi:MAG: hypothetical protein ACE5R7_00610 [Nitrosarchaeum sp.]
MSKNLLIVALVMLVSILIGIIMVTNYNWFSQEWLIGFAIVVGGITGLALLIYSKIRK